MCHKYIIHVNKLKLHKKIHVAQKRCKGFDDCYIYITIQYEIKACEMKMSM